MAEPYLAMAGPAHRAMSGRGATRSCIQKRCGRYSCSWQALAKLCLFQAVQIKSNITSRIVKHVKAWELWANTVRQAWQLMETTLRPRFDKKTTTITRCKHAHGSLNLQPKEEETATNNMIYISPTQRGGIMLRSIKSQPKGEDSVCSSYVGYIVDPTSKGRRKWMFVRED